MRAVAWIMMAVLALLAAPCAAQGGDAVDPGPLVPFAPVAHAERAGSGPVELVLVPDLASDWTAWRPFMERAGDAYTMVAVTLPGMCGTAPPREPERAVLIEDGRMLTPWLDNAAAAVLDVIEREGLTRPIIVGHGMGALIGYRLSAEHPGAIAGHVAVDGAPSTLLYTKPLEIRERTSLVQTRVMPPMRAMDDEAWAAWARELVTSGVTDAARAAELAGRAERTDRAVGLRYMVEYYGSDLTGAVRGMETPTLVIAAAGDVPVSRVRGLDRLRTTWYAHLEGMRDLEIVFVDDARHFVMDDAPEAFDGLLARFAARIAAGPTP